MGIQKIASIAGWFISMGKSIYKWMRTGGTPILGNPHLILKLNAMAVDPIIG
jgi:hypothetical protein